MGSQHSIGALNGMSQTDFVRVIGPVFEHTPWIAEVAWFKRPFQNVEALHQTLCGILHSASEEKQVELIRAHPDLVGMAALSGALTSASASEQSSAGLDKLSAEEIRQFQQSNGRYKSKFGFPFVICARLNKKEAILQGFEKRLKNTREQEIKSALAEIEKIALLRLQDIAGDTD